jgi:hypothetical protein
MDYHDAISLRDSLTKMPGQLDLGKRCPIEK